MFLSINFDQEKKENERYIKPIPNIQISEKAVKCVSEYAQQRVP